MKYVDEINCAHVGAKTHMYSTADTKFKKICMQNKLKLLDVAESDEDLWKAFDRIHESVGRSAYEQILVSIFQCAAKCKIPVNYKKIFRLNWIIWRQGHKSLILVPDFLNFSNQKEYAYEVARKLEEAGIRIEVDDRQEKIGYKIREAQLQKVPYMLILGEKEKESGNVGVRARKEGDIGAMELDKFISKIQEEINNFSN